MLVAERLSELRGKKNMSKKAVAAMLKLDQSSYGNYELGKRQPSLEMLNKLADYFQVSTDYLLGKTNSPHALRVPVLGSIPAGVPIEAIEDILDYEEVPIEWRKGGKEYFALKIKGNSMYPKYLDNDIVLFLTSKDCNSGDDCAVIVDGENATFKKVIKRPSGIVLQPLNTDEFEPEFYSNEEIENLPVRIIGIAEEIRRKTKRSA